MARPSGDGDVFRDLEREGERARGALEKPLPVIGVGKLVERKVAADDRKHPRRIRKGNRPRTGYARTGPGCDTDPGCRRSRASPRTSTNWSRSRALARPGYAASGPAPLPGEAARLRARIVETTTSRRLVTSGQTIPPGIVCPNHNTSTGSRRKPRDLPSIVARRMMPFQMAGKCHTPRLDKGVQVEDLVPGEHVQQPAPASARPLTPPSPRRPSCGCASAYAGVSRLVAI